MIESVYVFLCCLFVSVAVCMCLCIRECFFYVVVYKERVRDISFFCERVCLFVFVDFYA